MRWRVWILWLLFLVRGSFYCAMLPLWEGWDEYAHFAWLQHWIDKGTLPGFHDPISREIDESMRLTPLAYELRWIGPPYLGHEQWWALPETERTERVRRLKSLPPALAHQPALHTFDFYEAQQPPLYYWIASVPLRWAAAWPLQRRVLLLRLLSMALASAAIPLAWMAGRYLLGDSLAVLCAALLAVAPGFAIDVSRVANDCLAIVLVGVLFWLLARGSDSGWGLGLALGAALLSKAYLLALVPGLVIVWWHRKRQLAIALSVAFGIAGWWYIRNVVIGNALSGWSLRADTATILSGIWQINWLSAAHVVAKSFIWFGAWSFLTLKSWMYTVIELCTLAALALAVKTRSKELKIPAVLTGAYVLAMGYGVAVYWATQHVPNLPGWYLWPVGSMLAVLVTAGLRRFSILLIAGLAAIDLYSAAALLAPYYAGLVTRNRASAQQFILALGRLQTPLWLAAAWVAATIGIVVIAGMTNYGGEKRSGHRY
jgi:4-amino-4-deoxy-L-arabinose transferase-like glycosyltransferase